MSAIDELVEEAKRWFLDNPTWQVGGRAMRTLFGHAVERVIEGRALDIRMACEFLAELAADPRIVQEKLDPRLAYGKDILGILRVIIAEGIVQILQTDEALRKEDRRRRRI
jgi:hypothetical protein